MAASAVASSCPCNLPPALPQNRKIITRTTTAFSVAAMCKSAGNVVCTKINDAGVVSGPSQMLLRFSSDALQYEQGKVGAMPDGGVSESPVKIIGVEPSDANAMALSLHLGQRVMLDQVGGFADGVAVKEVGVETFRLCKELTDGVVLVDRNAICASIKDMFEEKRSILEPAGALALAGAEAYCRFYNLKDANVMAITSGANMNFDRIGMVSELANGGRRQEAVLATFMPEVFTPSEIYPEE